MSFKQTKELRQAGKLDEALQVAYQALEENPNDIWNKRAAAWVFYEFLKKNTHITSFQVFKENLIKIKDLNLPEDEKMIFDSCAWQVGSLVYSLHKNEPIDYNKINEIFEIIKAFHFTKPTDAYSFLFKAFLKCNQGWNNFIQFFEWWGLENLRPEDFLKEEYNGKKMMSIAEQAYIAYSKKLLEGESIDSFGQQRIIDKEKIKNFLPKLDEMIENHPDYQYPPYFKAKLLLALGNDGNILSAFLPFAKQKRNDFWVWDLMAEIFSEDKELQFACYCKSLSLKTPEEFLVKIRTVFAQILFNKGLYDEAKTEIAKVIETREKNEWKLPVQITQWIAQEWYKNANIKKDNKDFYKIYLIKAEEILFKDLLEEIVVVEFVNEDKKIVNFVKNEQKHGYFSYNGLMNKPKIGDIYKVRFNQHSKEGKFQIFTATLDNSLQSEALKKIKGKIKKSENQEFAFVDNVFIEPKVVKQFHLENDQDVTLLAILSFNKSKNKWGWKAVKLNENEK
jgi:hypothetical protein